ncbi:MAG: 50S ribosomal protein L6 [Gemmatimonadales bacterium]|jgi:large subunit ribosomal protein L6|nr:MAG: 50S ribosomal protein L6 [Gemmatimonadales bacterium]
MSRIGKRPVTVPKGVEITLDGSALKVKGPNGELDLNVHPEMSVTLEEGEVRVERPSDAPRHRALHGLTRALINNMVEGVTAGFTRILEIQGVGYRAEMKGNTLNLALGFSHPVEFEPPEGVSIECPNQTTVVVKGADKQAVGQTAAVIRGYRPPEPYKGKGIRYQGEQVRRKAGKTAGA